RGSRPPLSTRAVRTARLLDPRSAAVPELADRAGRIPGSELLGEGVHAPTRLHPSPRLLGLLALPATRREVGLEGVLHQRATVDPGRRGLGIDLLEQVVLQEDVDACHTLLPPGTHSTTHSKEYQCVLGVCSLVAATAQLFAKQGIAR